jgi:glycosyltransferase involved in cell wall biosynthesis
MLTIAIPTFNRPKELEQCVKALLPQLTSDVELLIVDNASDVPVTTVLAELLPKFPDVNIRIHRNAHNIGGNSNILRCVEFSETEWLWLLGDDDVPHENALQTALDEIAKNPKAICINFNSVFGPKFQDMTTVGRHDFLARCQGVGNVIFISSNLYRAGSMRKNLYIGHRYSYSMAPHFALMLYSMKDGDEVVFRNNELVEAGVGDGANHWSSIAQALSWPTLLELPLPPRDRKLLFQKLQIPSVTSVIIQLLGAGMKTKDFSTQIYFYRQVVGRMVFYATPKERLKIVAGRWMLALPGPSIWFVNLLLKRARGSSVAQRLRRDLDDPHG